MIKTNRALNLTVAALALAVSAVTGCGSTDTMDLGDNVAESQDALKAPRAPIGLTATAQGTSSIALKWKQRSLNEDGFIVQRSKSEDGPFEDVVVVGTNVTSTADSDLSAGTEYFYRVAAFNKEGNSANSAVASATTEGAPAPECDRNDPATRPVLTISSPDFLSGPTLSGIVEIKGLIEAAECAPLKSYIDLQLIVDGAVVASMPVPEGATSLPFSLEWDTTQSPNGAHEAYLQYGYAFSSVAFSFPVTTQN